MSATRKNQLSLIHQAVRALAFTAIPGLTALGSSGALASPASTTFNGGSFPSGTPFDIRFHGALLGAMNDPFDLPAPWAGQMILQSTKGDSFMAWCVDLFHDLNVNGISPTNTYTYVSTTLSKDSSASTLAASNSLSAQQVHDVLALANYGNQQLANMASGFSHDVFSGAVQVAIWDIVYQGRISYEVMGSAVNGFSPQDFADTVSDLEGLAPSLGVGSAEALINLDNYGAILSQGLVGNFQNKMVNSPAAVPEPGSLAMIGMGLIVAASAKRRRKT